MWFGCKLLVDKHQSYNHGRLHCVFFVLENHPPFQVVCKCRLKCSCTSSHINKYFPSCNSQVLKLQHHSPAGDFTNEHLWSEITCSRLCLKWHLHTVHSVSRLRKRRNHLVSVQIVVEKESIDFWNEACDYRREGARDYFLLCTQI